MKKKRSKYSHKKTSIKNKKRHSSKDFFSNESPSDEDFLDTLTESLSNKLEDVKGILDISDFLSQADTNASNSDESISPFKEGDDNTKNSSTSPSEDENSTSQDKSNSSDTKTPGGPSGYTYAPEMKIRYRFGFTNSEFIAFLAGLNAIEYIIVLSLITVLIMINLNTKEREIIYNFFITIGQTMGSGVDQTAFQVELESQKEDAEKDNALQTDFNYIYTEMNALQNEIKQLKEQLKTSTS